MALTIPITVGQVSGGNYQPVSSLSSTNFTIRLSSATGTTISYSTFSNEGNGNYVFGGFTIPAGSTAQGASVNVAINGTLRPELGTFIVYADNDMPWTAQKTIDLAAARLDRGVQGQLVSAGCDTIFGQIQYDDAVAESSITGINRKGLIHKFYVDDNFATTASVSAFSSGAGYVTTGSTQNIVGKKAFSGGTTFELGTSATTATAFRITTASNPPNGGVIILDAGYQANNVGRFNFYDSDMQVKSVTASTVSSATAYLNYADVYKTGTQNVFRVRADVAFTGLPKTAIQIYGGSDNTVIDFANSTIVNFNQTDLPDVIGSKQRHVNANFPSNLVNKRYQFFTDAVGSCNSPSVENQYDIIVHNTGGTISGTTANISNVAYINYVGLGNPRILLQADSFSKNSVWRDLKLKREDSSLTFTNQTFENCEIYLKNAFQNTALTATFINCKLKNCIVSVDYRAASLIQFTDSSNEVYNTVFSSAPTFTVGDVCSNTGFNTGLSASDWS